MTATTDQPMAPDTKPATTPDAKSAAPPDAVGAKADAQDDLKTLPMEEVEKRLESSPDGLSQAEAVKRLATYGPNEIVEKKTNPLLKFLTYFWGPIPWMIEVAVVLSGVVRHWPDFFIILVLLVATGVVGFWEERQAGNAIDALKAKLAIKALVQRDKKWISAAARDLVPGDVIRVRLGDIVPADARLLADDPVQVDQSALTGESLPATHASGDAVFSGSIMRQGENGAMCVTLGAPFVWCSISVGYVATRWKAVVVQKSPVSVPACEGGDPRRAVVPAADGGGQHMPRMRPAPRPKIQQIPLVLLCSSGRRHVPGRLSSWRADSPSSPPSLARRRRPCQKVPSSLPGAWRNGQE